MRICVCDGFTVVSYNFTFIAHANGFKSIQFPVYLAVGVFCVTFCRCDIAQIHRCTDLRVSLYHKKVL